MLIEKLEIVRKLKFQIECINDNIETLRTQMRNHAIVYSDVPKTVGYKDNAMEIFLARLDELETKKARLQMRIDMVLEELMVLPETLYKVVFLKCVDGLSWEEVANKTGYSKQSCYRFYNEAKAF